MRDHASCGWRFPLVQAVQATPPRRPGGDRWPRPRSCSGAHLAGNPSAAGVHDLADLWRSLRTRDIFPLRPRAALAGLIGHESALTTSRPLRRLLHRCLRFDHL